MDYVGDGGNIGYRAQFCSAQKCRKIFGRTFLGRKTFAPPKYNVVLMGDSRVYRGLSPEIIESHLPDLKVLNFGYSNGGLNPTMFDAAEKKLAQNDKAKIIVLGISANAITDFTAANKQYQQELNRPREEIFERIYFNPLQYWFSATSPEKLKKHFSKVEETSYYRNTYFMNGYVESDKFPQDSMEAVAYYINDYTNYKVTPEKLDALFQQVKKWTSTGIRVVGFVPPISQPMRNLEDSLGFFNETTIKAGFERASGNWIDIESTQYKTYDGSHLTIESAQKISHIIGKEVEKLVKN